MGSGRWSTDVYSAAAHFRAASGTSAFAYSDSGATRVHPSLDPRDALRESRDSAEHPRSLAIAVLFDVTGSMRHVPRAMQAKLPQLLGLLLRQGYAEDPQIMFGAIGDATCDRAPLQVGQFESDNRMDDDLGRILLEGGGGGQKTESYELAMYFMARHTSIDCHEKRGKRGYLFIIGDEMAYPRVKRGEAREVIGDRLPADIPASAVTAELLHKWDTYYILPAAASYSGDAQVLASWRALLGQNVIELSDLDAVCETIALAIGLGEAVIDLDEGLDHLSDMGSAAGGTVSTALATISAGRSALTIATPPADLGGPQWEQQAVTHYIVADLGYGDAGKGTVVDWLCSHGGAEPVHTVVRFNGGAQAAHNVVTPDGRHHTFAQFGSGTFTTGVRTHLSRFMLVDPAALAAEAAHLGALGIHDALDHLTVDRDALLTTPYHRAANQARERARGEFRHGSCGMGIGETASYALRHPADAPRAGDAAAPRTLARKLAALRDALAGELGPLDAPAAGDVTDACLAFAGRVALVDRAYLGRVLREGPAVFEGAQGMLLDEGHGFHPYTTWSTTTFANAEALLAEAGQAATRIGVVRCYMTRHGPGPFVTEDPALELPEPHNRRNAWQGEFRTGHFDTVALRYAIEAAGGADVIALTHLDIAGRHPELRACHAYDISGATMPRLPVGRPGDLGAQEALTGCLLRARPVYHSAGISDWPGFVEDVLATPVALASWGPRAWDKRLVRPLAKPGVRVR